MSIDTVTPERIEFTNRLGHKDAVSLAGGRITRSSDNQVLGHGGQDALMRIALKLEQGPPENWRGPNTAKDKP